MPIPSGFKNKDEYAAYMRRYRKRQKEAREQVAVKIREVRHDPSLSEKEKLVRIMALFESLEPKLHVAKWREDETRQAAKVDPPEVSGFEKHHPFTIAVTQGKRGKRR